MAAALQTSFSRCSSCLSASASGFASGSVERKATCFVRTPTRRRNGERNGEGMIRRKLVVALSNGDDVVIQDGERDGSFRRSLLSAAAALSLSLSLCGVASARPEGVNRPDLLPKTFSPVIDVAGFLSPQQEGRIAQAVTYLEEETGFKLRVLAQNYPETPGLAIKEFWKVDDNTIVFVADPSIGNILNFNVGSTVDLSVPRSFWSRLAGKYGNVFYWRENGEDMSIEAAVAAIGECLREPAGPLACSDIK